MVSQLPDRFAPAPDNGAHAFCHALPDLWHQMGVIYRPQIPELAERNCRQAVPALAKAAAAIVPDHDSPLLFHPYLSGERTPHNDAAAKGGFFGLSRTDGVPEMAFAVLEGVAFAIADCVDVLRAAGSTPTRFPAQVAGQKCTMAANDS